MSSVAAIDFDLISKEDFDSQLAERGVEIPAFRMRNWQTRELMPRAFRGGLAYYAPESVAQALEASRLFIEKNDEDYVGWSLWWQGFEVGDMYWRPTLDNNPPLHAGFARKFCSAAASVALPKGQPLEAVIWQLHGALMEGRSGAVLASKNKTLDRLAAMQNEEAERILQSDLNVAETFSTMMRVIADAPKPKISPLLFKEANRGKIFDARNDVRGVLEAAAAMHDAAKLLFPGRARRLKAAKFFSETRSKAIKAELVMRWMQAKADAGVPLESEAILNMRADAFATLSAAQALRTAMDRSPKLARAASPKRLREAAMNRPGLDTLCDAIRSAS